MIITNPSPPLPPLPPPKRPAPPEPVLYTVPVSNFVFS